MNAKVQQELTWIVCVHVAGNTANIVGDHRCECSVSKVYFESIKIKYKDLP